MEDYPRESITDVYNTGYQIVGAIELIERYLNRMGERITIISNSEKLKTSKYHGLRMYLIGRQTEARNATYDTLRVWKNLKRRFKELYRGFSEDTIKKDNFFFDVKIVTIPKEVVPNYGENTSQLKSHLSPSVVDMI